jgi:hypothetical protein
MSLHITSNQQISSPKLFLKKVNPFTALKNFSPFHFTFYFTLFIYLFTYLVNPTLHFTLLFLTTTYFPSPHFHSLLTFYRLYIPSLVYIFLTLALKICVLPWEVPIAPLCTDSVRNSQKTRPVSRRKTIGNNVV